MAASATIAMTCFQGGLSRRRGKPPPSARRMRASIENPDSMLADNAAARIEPPFNLHPSPRVRKVIFDVCRSIKNSHTRAQRVVDQGLAERPDGTRHPVAAGNR